MKLRNKLHHMFDAKVNVGGTIYSIDNNGVIDNVSEEHASILLQNAAWCTVVDRKPVERKPVIERKPTKDVELDLDKMKKSDLIKLLEYKKIDFDTDMKKSELKALLEGK